MLGTAQYGTTASDHPPEKVRRLERSEDDCTMELADACNLASAAAARPMACSSVERPARRAPGELFVALDDPEPAFRHKLPEQVGAEER